MKIITKLQKDGSLLIDKQNRSIFLKKYLEGQLFDTVTKKYKDVRNLSELRLYWVLMNRCSFHTPEYILRMFDIKYISDKVWHELLKAKFLKSSIAFDSMNEGEFRDYFTNCIDWLSSFIFQCTPEQLMNDVKDNSE